MKSAGSGGHSIPAIIDPAHHAPNLPIGVPRLRPYAPPLAPVHAIQAMAVAGSTTVTMASASPCAAIADSAVPATAAVATTPFDCSDQGAARAASASTASSSATLSPGGSSSI